MVYHHHAVHVLDGTHIFTKFPLHYSGSKKRVGFKLEVQVIILHLFIFQQQQKDFDTNERKLPVPLCFG